MSNEHNEKNEKNETKKNKFSHLSHAAKVMTKSNTKALWGGLVVGVVLVLIVVSMLSGHHDAPIKKTESEVNNDNDLILQRNERHLMALRNQTNSPPPLATSFAPPTSPPVDSKAMKIRRNAPTEMYSAVFVSHHHSGATPSGSNQLLVGDGAINQFANQQSEKTSIVQATTLIHPRFTIAEGELIHASLETAINSDLPGRVRAVITEPVYTYLGEKPVLPAGSRLIGQYTSLASNGAASARVFVIWNRVITPSGISILINSPGSDALGRAGMGADAVDTHFWKIFGTATLLSVMGATAANVGVGSYDQPNSANLYRQAIASSFQQSAQTSLSQNLAIKPTLHVHQGDEVTVFVAHDLDLFNVLGKTA